MPVEPVRVFVSLGTNIQRTKNLKLAASALGDRFSGLEFSPVYESAAVGFDGPEFYNQVAAFDTTETAFNLTRLFKQIEDAQGRDRSRPGLSSRTLDLDLLLYGDERLHKAGLDIPRGEIMEYAFVLKPLADIAGDRRHPETGKTFAAMWADFDGDKTSLREVSPGNVKSGAGG